MLNSRHISFFMLLMAIGLPVWGEDPHPTHPLDPLSTGEIKSVVKALEKIRPENSEISLIVKEPPKDEVLRYKPGEPFRREAFVVIYDRSSNRTFEAVVAVDARRGTILQWNIGERTDRSAN